MVTRTEQYHVSEVFRGINTMEQAGWAVRQIVEYKDPYYSDAGAAGTRPDFLVVFERPAPPIDFSEAF